MGVLNHGIDLMAARALPFVLLSALCFFWVGHMGLKAARGDVRAPASTFSGRSPAWSSPRSPPPSAASCSPPTSPWSSAATTSTLVHAIADPLLVLHHVGPGVAAGTKGRCPIRRGVQDISFAHDVNQPAQFVPM